MNRQILWLLFLVLIWPKPLLAQLPGNATLVLFPGTPSGNCNSRQLALDESNGSLYTCVNAAHGNQGTWQIIAGGGGGGGWNPPSNTPGNTIFGNNTVGTGSPSFFTPGGDVSFSAGNFSVNSLHFGPNALALTNTGIATGNCLQVSGSNIIGGACGTGGGGGLSGSGTVNLIPKFTAATALGNSLLTDNGTTLTYVGTGGIAAPQITMTGAGPYQLTSVTGALPALPGAGKNALVSGTDGWYVSNANGAFFKIEPPGTGGTGGAVSSVFTRTGAVTAAQGDYNITQITNGASTIGPSFTGTPTAPTAAQTVNNTQLATTAFVHAAVAAGATTAGVASFNGRTGPVTAMANDYAVAEVTNAASLISPNFSGTPQSPTPPQTDNSDRIATTAFVKTALGGTPAQVPIGHSAQAPICGGNTVAGNSAAPALAVNITEGDTVIIIATANGLSAAPTFTINDGAGSVYSQVDYRPHGSSPSILAMSIMATAPGASKAATSITVSKDTAGTFSYCLTTWVGVHAVVAGYKNSFGAASAFPIPLAIQDNSFMLAASAVDYGVTAVSFAPPGQALANSTLTNNPRSAICQATTPTAATVSCDVTWTPTSTASRTIVMAIELQPGVTAGPTFAGPKVVGFHRASINVTSAVTDTPFMLCPIVACPAGSFYRIAWDFLGITGCTGSGPTGNGVFQVNVDYIDEASPTEIHHTGMISSPGANISGANHAFGSRLMTVAAPLPMTGTPTWAANTGIWVTTSVPTACSGAAGTVQMVVSIERLQ